MVGVSRVLASVRVDLPSSMSSSALAAPCGIDLFSIFEEVRFMLRRCLLLSVVLSLGICGWARESSAQNGGCGPWGGYWYGPPYTFYEREHIPYFALHPPVYYSLPVPRSYGYSPFAYPPGTMTPDVVIDNSVEIENPHVPQSNAKPLPKGKGRATAKLDQSASRSETIINPFVLDDVQVAGK